jgi:formylglycine-generating enzyme required for sulfatase activity
LPPGSYRVDVRCGAGHQLESISIVEWGQKRSLPGGPNKDDLQIQLPRGQRITLNVQVVPLPSAAKPAAPPLAVAPFDAAKAKEYQDAWGKHVGVPVEIENAIGMNLHLIPPGRFVMGTPKEMIDLFMYAQQPEQEKLDLYTEAPPRAVDIPAPFYLGRYEVTVGQFKRFIDETGYKTTAETNGKGGTGAGDVSSPDYTWRHADDTISDEHPVVQITLDDTAKFCGWLSKKDGRKYVIPDEAQWEFACRAGTTTLLYNGVTETDLDRVAWMAFNSQGISHPVGGKLPNAFGLHDMLGNVHELCLARDRGVVARGGNALGGFRLNRCAARRPVPEDRPYFRRGFRVAIVGDLKVKT